MMFFNKLTELVVSFKKIYLELMQAVYGRTKRIFLNKTYHKIKFQVDKKYT